MFNSEKIKELERRIKCLEQASFIQVDPYPLEEGSGRISATDLLQRLLAHFHLTLVSTPAHVDMVKRGTIGSAKL